MKTLGEVCPRSSMRRAKKKGGAGIKICLIELKPTRFKTLLQSSNDLGGSPLSINVENKDKQMYCNTTSLRFIPYEIILSKPKIVSCHFHAKDKLIPFLLHLVRLWPDLAIKKTQTNPISNTRTHGKKPTNHLLPRFSS